MIRDRMGGRVTLSRSDRLARSLAAGLLFGLAAGLALGMADLLSQQYLSQGLLHLALRRMARSLWSYTAAGCIGAVVAAIIDALSARLLRGRAARLALPVDALAFLAGVLPVWGWSIWHDFGLYPRDRQIFYLVVGLTGAAILIYYAAVGRRIRREGRFLQQPRSRRNALAGATLVALASGLADRAAVRPPAGSPNVLVVVMDTLRADRVSCLGGRPGITPELDALAAEGLRFPNFYSTSSWTVPSHASLFTGLYAARHRATQEYARLDNRYATLAELLSEAGYQTWGASGNPAVGWVTNMMQGFDAFIETYREAVRRYYAAAGVHPNNAAFSEFLRAAPADRPFFAFINYIEAHNPYAPPDAFRDRFLDAAVPREEAARLGRREWSDHYLVAPFAPRDLSIQSQLYDAEAAYVSSLVGGLLDDLRRDGRYGRTLIVVTSDHGEHFGEHGMVQHVFSLSNVLVHVPLILRLPEGRDGDAPRGIADPRAGQLVDLFSTILSRCGIDARSVRPQGIDLLAPLDAESPPRAIFAEYYFPSQVLRSDPRLIAGAMKLAPCLRRLRSYQEQGHRLIWSSNGRHEFYDLTADPGETKNLYDADDPPELARRFLVRLDRAAKKYAEGVPFDPMPDVHDVLPGLNEADPETRRVLKELGYVQD